MKGRLINFVGSKVFLTSVFVVLFLLSRFLYLGFDTINPDGVNWHYRSQQFIVGLKQADFAKTYQHYHPGVTLMWVSGTAIELYKQFTGIKTYDQYNFLAFDFVAKSSVVLVQLVLSLILLNCLHKIIGWKYAYTSLLLFSMEPFFLGNSRLYHMDVFLALFVLISLCYSWLALQNFTYKKAVLAGVFLSFSFLTKSIGIGALIFVLLYSLVYFLNKKDKKVLLKYTGVVLVSFLIATFIFFPALWVNPFYYIGQIFSEAERIGVRDGHGQILFGEYTRDGGPLFYPLVLLMKITPFMIAGVLLYFISSFKKVLEVLKKPSSKYSNFYFFLTVFYLGYFVVMIFPSKKIDRYMIPIYPFFGILATSGFMFLRKFFIKKNFVRVFDSFLILFVVMFYAVPLISLYPYYFTYTSPVFGSADSANKIIAQKPFGIGIPALKQYILSNYGDYPRLGFIDTKPMKSIYPNSKVSDIRVNGVSDYDLLVLGVNEDIPDKILQSKYKFNKDASLYINGLEYWRIYVKEKY